MVVNTGERIINIVELALHMVLKDVQCPKDGCGGMVQTTIDANEEITGVATKWYKKIGSCPECGAIIKVQVE